MMHLAKWQGIGASIAFLIWFLIGIKNHETTLSGIDLFARSFGNGIFGALAGSVVISGIYKGFYFVVERRKESSEQSCDQSYKQAKSPPARIKNAFNTFVPSGSKSEFMYWTFLFIVCILVSVLVYWKYVPREIPNNHVRQLDGRAGFGWDTSTFNARIHNRTDYEIERVTLKIQIIESNAKWPERLVERLATDSYESEEYVCEFDTSVPPKTVGKCNIDVLMGYEKGHKVRWSITSATGTP